jgi:hypothetical protein
MGRRSDEVSGVVELARVPMVDGDYDEGGAYWGGVADNPLWCAWNDDGAMYLRAPGVEEAIAILTARGCEWRDTDMVMREEIIECAARIMWVNAWASWSEENDHYPAGSDLDAIAPPTPDNVRDGASKVIASIERMNGDTIVALYRKACAMPGKHYRKPTVERFGECIGFQAVGTGVSWADDHPDPRYRIPCIEVYAYDRTSADVGNVSEIFF